VFTWLSRQLSYRFRGRGSGRRVYGLEEGLGFRVLCAWLSRQLSYRFRVRGSGRRVYGLEEGLGFRVLCTSSSLLIQRHQALIQSRSELRKPSQFLSSLGSPVSPFI